MWNLFSSLRKSLLSNFLALNLFCHLLLSRHNYAFQQETLDSSSVDYNCKNLGRSAHNPLLRWSSHRLPEAPLQWHTDPVYFSRSSLTAVWSTAVGHMTRWTTWASGQIFHTSRWQLVVIGENGWLVTHSGLSEKRVMNYYSFYLYPNRQNIFYWLLIKTKLGMC